MCYNSIAIAFKIKMKGEKMKDKHKDFLLFYDWFVILDRMSHKNMHMVLRAMVNYQAEGIEPPDFPDKIRDVTDLIFAQLRRRMESSEFGKRGRALQLARKKAGSGADSLTEKNDLAPEDCPEDSPEAMPPTQDKTKTETETETETEQDTYSLSCESEYVGGGDAPRARAEREDNRCDVTACGADSGFEQSEHGDAEFADKGQRLAFGRHQNVFLTESEYAALKSRLRDADSYINTFSEKLFSKGYRYSDHYLAILSWWERDRSLSGNKPSAYEPSGNKPSAYEPSHSKPSAYEPFCARQGAYDPLSNSTFDTEDFIEAALRRTEKMLEQYQTADIDVPPQAEAQKG